MRARKLICLFLLAGLFFPRLYAYTERDLLQKAADLSAIRSSLVMDRKWVQYPAYTDRAGWDNLLDDSKAYFIGEGEKLLKYQWQVVTATDYLEYERSGNRRIMEDPFGANNRAITTLLMAELAEGKGRFMDQLINGVFHACEMSSWVLSAHLGREQVTHRSLPDGRKHVIDLTAGDVGGFLSWTYYFLHAEFDKVNPSISERLRKELQERILDTYMNDNKFWWIAYNYKPGDMVNNWNPWCNFNVLQSFFLLEDDPDVLAKAVYRSMVSVDKFINYTHSDGACEEGPSYWGHAAGKMYDYLQMLYDGTGGKISIFQVPMIKNMGEYIVRSYVGNDWVVNFADASAKGGGNAPLIYRYGKAVGSDVMMHYAAYIESRSKGESLASGYDVFRTLQTLLYRDDLKKVAPTFQSPAYTWYPETEFCYMTNTNGWFLAAKGGFNNESHNHNDVGTFSLYVNNTPILIDAGVGTYTRQTFSPERYTIWTMQCNYHNLPMINGVPQQFGTKFKATDTQFNPKQMKFSANIATAYPAEANVKKWVRSYTLGKNAVKVEDAFDLTQASAPNQVNFLTWGKVDISVPGEIAIDVNGQQMLLKYDGKAFTPALETIRLDDPRLSNVWGKEIYRISLNALKLASSGVYTYSIQTKK